VGVALSSAILTAEDFEDSAANLLWPALQFALLHNPGVRYRRPQRHGGSRSAPRILQLGSFCRFRCPCSCSVHLLICPSPNDRKSGRPRQLPERLVAAAQRSALVAVDGRSSGTGVFAPSSGASRSATRSWGNRRLLFTKRTQSAWRAQEWHSCGCYGHNERPRAQSRRRFAYSERACRCLLCRGDSSLDQNPF
jgi:hypothetical protein